MPFLPVYGYSSPIIVFLCEFFILIKFVGANIMLEIVNFYRRIKKVVI
jgi:hypothetical protein